MDAELILKVLAAIAAGLGTIASACWIVIQMMTRAGLVTKKMTRDDSVDAAAAQSTVTVLQNTEKELQRLYTAIQTAESRAAAAETRASQQMGLVLELTRNATAANSRIEEMSRMLGIAKKAQNELIQAGQLADPLVDIPTGFLLDDPLKRR